MGYKGGHFGVFIVIFQFIKAEYYTELEDTRKMQVKGVIQRTLAVTMTSYRYYSQQLFR